MADNPVITLPEVVMPAPRRRSPRPRRPRPQSPDVLTPGPAHQSQLSEQDVRPSAGNDDVREQLADTARALVESRPLDQVTLNAPRPQGGLVDDLDDEETETQARVDRAMAPLSPSQRTAVQSLPVVSREDSPENTEAIVDASARQRGLHMPARPQLKTTTIDLGGGSLRQATPYSPAPSARLRAPALFEDDSENQADRALPASPYSTPAGRTAVPPTDEEPLAPVGAATPRVGLIDDTDADPTDEEIDAQLAQRDREADEWLTRYDPDLATELGVERALTPYEMRLKTAQRRPGTEIAQDEADRRQAQRLQRAQRGLAVISAIPALFGGRSGGTSGVGLAQMSAGIDPNAPLDRIRQRREAREAEARRLDEESYERTMADRRMALEDRRIAQAESATEARNRRTSAQYDVDSTDARALREAYEATIGGLSPEAARLLSGWIPSRYGGALDLDSQTASGMQTLIEQLNNEIARQAELNPRAFRLGVHGGGRGRGATGRLGGELRSGGGRGHNYGDTLANTYADDVEMDGGVTPRPAVQTQQAPTNGAPRRATGTGGGTRGAPATTAPVQASAAPQEQATTGRPLWDRPPTRAEVEEDPRREAQERLIQLYARENNLNLSNVDDRRAAAGAVNDLNATQAQELRNRASDRGRAQHAIIMRDAEPRIQRRDVLTQLGRRLSSATDAQLMAALHGGPLISRVAGAADLRSEIFSFLNDYYRTYGGAAVSNGEERRYASAMGADSSLGDPRAFQAFIRNRSRDLDREIDSLTRQYPDGWDVYVQNEGAR